MQVEEIPQEVIDRIKQSIEDEKRKSMPRFVYVALTWKSLQLE
jgi:hypothetical protein